jgi:formylglycine-generating enzyme required for sulfatase activity
MEVLMMMRRLLRGAMPWLLVGSGCAPDQIVLLIHVKYLLPETTSLQVNAQLDRNPPQVATYTQGLRTLAVSVSNEVIGLGQLSLSLHAVTTDGCIKYGAQYSTELSLESPYREIDVNLEALSHRLCRVPSGSFIMGSPGGEFGRNSDETQHAITLTTDFWIAESEVTQRQYKNLMGSNPSNFQGDDLPVESVTWFDAVAYCNALSVKEKLPPCYHQVSETTVRWPDVKCTGYRLPTEAEWEYAANPTTLPRTVHAGSDMVDGVAWYDANSSSKTHAVKTKTANGRRLYDLSGNVWEWVWDWYQSNYEALPSTDPIGPSTGALRVFRGGSWSHPATNSRVAQRGTYAPTFRGTYLGFRIVRSSP